MLPFILVSDMAIKLGLTTVSDVSESFFVESESQALRVRVTYNFFESSHITWSSRVRGESQELSSHFESLVCESMSSQMKFHIFSMTFLCYEIASNMLYNGTR